MNLAALAVTFALIAPAELPDKTFIATLVLATRFTPVAVWFGASAAFAVQTVIAVLAGQLLTLLPERLVLLGTGTLFALGAVLMFGGARSVDPAEEEAAERRAVTAAATSHRRAFTVSFLVLIAAEWGDLSQLTTATLTARFRAPVEVGIGAFLALALVAGLAVLAGRWLIGHIRFSLVRRISGSVLALLAALTYAEAAGLLTMR